MPDKVDWSEWYEMTRSLPPSELLVEAIPYVKDTGKALDVGGGALKDTRYLLSKGFDVTVIDSNPLLMKEATGIKSDKLHPFVTSFEDFLFPENEYVLVSAMQCLSYCESAYFDRVIMSIKSSLRKGGIFCGQMYDAYDQESHNLHKTYKTADEARDYLKDMEVILFQEEETKKGRTKHWHIYNFIARK